MPNPDLRDRNANPNDPHNIHTSRAENAAYVPPERSGGGGLLVALVAVVAIAAIGYFIISGGDNTRVAEGPAPVVEGDNNTPSVTITPPAEEPAIGEGADEGAATEEPAPIEEPADGGSTESTN
jgi:hypothetical protein